MIKKLRKYILNPFITVSIFLDALGGVYLVDSRLPVGNIFVSFVVLLIDLTQLTKY